jgi:rhodanese-related sulfurtransferase
MAPLSSSDNLNLSSCTYYSSPFGRFSMADALRITVDDLKRRMEAGEDFALIDVRNPQAWGESNSMLPEAIRVPPDKLEENLPRIPKNRPVVAYCT